MLIILIMSWSIGLKISIYVFLGEGTAFGRILIVSQAICFCIVFSPFWKKNCKIESIMHVLCLPEKQVKLTTFRNIIFYFTRWNLAIQNFDSLIMLYPLLRSLGYLSERDSKTKTTILRTVRQKNITRQKEN